MVAFGANLGDRAATLHAAATALADADGVELTAMSGLHESIALKPGGADPTAPEYLNAVALVSTTLAPAALLAELHRIEARPRPGARRGVGAIAPSTSTSSTTPDCSRTAPA